MSEFRLASGVQIGEYVLESRIGSGGMGEVWRANQPLIETTVAIKILTFEAAARKSQLERFLREARAVNRVQHRNLAKIFSFGELSDGRPYFVMEFLAGLNLRDFLRKNAPLPFAMISHIVEQICRTLIAVHEQNVIHRDLKPENVFLVTEPGALPFVKVLDFGVAKLTDKDTSGKREHPTQTGATLGTPGYMSPEQYENSKTVDVRADIYSVAVIIFEMITGEHPFELGGETAYVVIAKQLTTDPPKPSEKNKSRNIPRELDNFLLKALSRRPEDRPRDCKEFLLGFHKALGDLKNERELPTHAGEPTQLNASYENIKAKKSPPSKPAIAPIEEPKAPDSTVPAIQLDPRSSTQITPSPVSTKAKIENITKFKDLKEDDDSQSALSTQKFTPDIALSTQKLTGPQLLALQKNSDPMRTTPDVDVPELLRDLIEKTRQKEQAAAAEAKAPQYKSLAEEIEPEEIIEDDQPAPVHDAPTSAQQIIPVNTPEPISLPTTSPGLKVPSKALVAGTGIGAIILFLLGWFFLSNNAPNPKPPTPTSTPASVASSPTTTSSQSAPSTEPALNESPDTKKNDPCKSYKEESKRLITSKSWADSLKVLAAAQDKCPKDAEIQRLFGYTYEQKGDKGFACIRYAKAISFGLTGTTATRTKKAMKELKCP